MSARILVVDDIPANVKLLEAKLTQEYYEVITANSGREAIQQAKDESPDIILLDVMMPEMNGFETCKILREDPDTSHIPIIMVTALSEKKDRIQGLEAGADDFLTKPVNDMALFARVKSLVRLKVMVDELRLRGQTGIEFGMDGKMDKATMIDAKIMVIDDDVVESRKIVEKLSAFSQNVYSISEPDNVIEQLQSKNIDVVLVSTQMSDYDGLRICSQIRGIEATRSVSIIGVVDEFDNASIVKGLEIGLNDYISSPVDVNELLARVKTQIKRKKYQDALRTNFRTSVSLAVTDSLTGLYNRRYMDSHLETTMKDCEQNGRSMCALIIDIDHFKEVNDTHGHDIGDDIIREFANRISHNMRPSDMVVRYGGEEFIIFLPGTNLENGSMVAERIRQRIANLPFQVNIADGELVKTCSIGITTMNKAGGDTPEMFIKRADQALLEAKRTGRNKVVALANSYPEPQKKPSFE